MERIPVRKSRSISAFGPPFTDDVVKASTRTGTHKGIVQPSFGNAWDPDAKLYGAQITESVGNPWKTRDKGKRRDVGSEFMTRKIQYGSISHPRVTWGYRHTVIDIVERDAPITPVPLVPFNRGIHEMIVDHPYHGSEDAVLDAWGAKAIALCAPTNPIAGLSTAIGELKKDGLPSLVGLKALKEKNLKAVGSEWLNFNFGVKPLISDLKDTAKALKHADAVIRQLERDSGRPVRRKYSFPPEITTTVTRTPNSFAHTPHGVSAYHYDGGMAGRGTLITTTTTKKDRWFSGSFMYHLPKEDGIEGLKRMASQADRVLGLRPGINDLWNLLPWSWLVDWKYNVGDSLTNLSNLLEYGLVLQYGYIMEKSVKTTTYELHGHRFKGAPGQVISLTVIDTIKRRRQATPWGFGSLDKPLTAYQLSILAALGLNRV